MKRRVERFDELDVYKAAFALQQRIFEISKKWPRDETYALTDQIRRASRSVGANISEAWVKRRYVAHWIAKLTDADGELNETRQWLSTARECGYATSAAATEMLAACDTIGGKIGRMIVDAESWTG